MIRIDEIIIVEGKYDTAAVRRCVDTLVLETGGFRIFKDPELCRTIRILAEKRGIVILTDSDSAGFVIRNKILSFVDKKYVKNAYIPDIHGIERRKTEPSKEGLLGVEGMSDDVIVSALKTAGVKIDGETMPTENITKADFYEMGLSGREDSAEKRRKLQKELGLPKYLSANKLFDILRRL